MEHHVENLRKKIKARQDRLREAKEKNEAKREKWIRVNLIRRVLFGESFNLRVYVAKARIEQRHPYLSVAQKERIDVLFKNYRRRAFWAMADNGLMPKGLLNETIEALDNSSIMNKALIMNISDTTSASNTSTEDSANGSSAKDEGFNDSIKDNLDKEDLDLPRLVEYLDDPLEVGSTDYHKILGISSMDQQDNFEKWLNAKEKAEFPDPPEIPFDDTTTFEDFSGSFVASTVEF